MYEKFTDRARRVMQLANQEAQRFNHEYIGTEHILLGLLEEGNGVAANVLRNLDIDLRKVRREIEKIIQSGPASKTLGRRPQTPRTKKVIEYAIEEARTLHHNYVGTEHLLLGLIREQEGLAAQVLMNIGLKPEDIRDEVLDLLGHDLESRGAGARQSQVDHGRDLYTELQDWPYHVVEAVKKIDAQIEQLDQEKEAAVAEQDFEKAAHLHDQAYKLEKRRRKILRSAQDKKSMHILEYDLYIPLGSPDGSPIEPEKLTRLRKRLVERFGGVVEFHHRLEGSWTFGKVTLRDEFIIFRVLSQEGPPAFAKGASTAGEEIVVYRDVPPDVEQVWHFFTQLKEELKAELRQEDILIVTRRSEVL
jgi:ATP-dependent Clp protease ATP-binding subunit ClpA